MNKKTKGGGKILKRIKMEIKKIKKDDSCEVLTEFKNINDPIIIRLYVDPEKETTTDYTYNSPSDKGVNPYAGGYFLLELFIGNRFPDVAPTVIFKTQVIHANISSKEGYIWLDALNKWKFNKEIFKDIISPIMELLINPNFEDAIEASGESEYKSFDTIKEATRKYATYEDSQEQFDRIKHRIEQDQENS